MTGGMERQLAVGHDPMLLAGLAMAGANPREGADGDDGILTAPRPPTWTSTACDLVVALGLRDGEGDAGVGRGRAGARPRLRDGRCQERRREPVEGGRRGTRLLMEGSTSGMLRKEKPLSPAEALREAALWLRDSKDAAGKDRFAAPRYWAAFVAYGG